MISNGDFELTDPDNGDFDIAIVNGDFNILNSKDELLHTLLVSFIGEFKLTPELGVGIDLYLNSNIKESDFEILITNALELDGFVPSLVSLEYDVEGELDIKIEGKYDNK